MHLATTGGYAELVTFLLKKGLSPDIEDKRGKTCLHYAGTHHHMSSQRRLVDDNYDREHLYQQESRLLFGCVVAFNGQKDIVQGLIAHNAEGEKQDAVPPRCDDYTHKSTRSHPCVCVCVCVGVCRMATLHSFALHKRIR